MTACGHCGADVSHRPYAAVRGKNALPSVSAISGMLDDGKSDTMPWASSLIAASTAVHSPQLWAHLDAADCTGDKDGLCAACRFLRYQFKVVWDAKRDFGSHIHHLALSWANGDDVEVDSVSEPYMDALERFYADCEPEWIEKERTVLYDKPWSHGYRGQFDGIAWLNRNGERERFLCDVKTGRYYPTEQTLQLAGYRYAQHLTTWENGTEHIDGPVPSVAYAAVVLLGDDGRYRLVELPANGDAHGAFLRLRDGWGFAKQMKRWAKEHPLPAIEEMEEVRV